MTLKELVKQENAQFVAIYKGKKTVYPEYVDEMIETHGEKEVIKYGIKDDILIVMF